MSDADNGFRFGTKASMWPKGGDWVHVTGDHPGYAKIRADEAVLDRFEGKLRAIEDKMQLALDMVRMLRVMLVGGHVRRDKLARLQERLGPKTDPEVMLAALAEKAAGDP